jgi:2-dehydropantoate 2-reductase
MKVVVVGCGGIGGVMAANLARAGADVSCVVGNDKIGAAVERDGLRVRELDGVEWSARPRATSLKLADERYDLAIVATQNTTLYDVLPTVAARASTVVTIQNGLPEDRARTLVGDRVVGCVVGWGASMVEPGVYQRTSKGGLQLGRPTPSSPDPQPVARLLESASPTVVVDDLAGVRWSKLAINCVTTTLGAVGGVPLGKLLSHRPIRRLALEIFAEVSAVAQQSGVKVQPVGGTLDIDKIAITDAERAMSIGSAALLYKHSVLMAVGFKYRRMRSSMLYALERGRPPEIDYLNGEIVARGQKLGVSTPVNAALVEDVRRLARGEATSSLSRLRIIFDNVVVGRVRAAA